MSPERETPRGYGFPVFKGTRRSSQKRPCRLPFIITATCAQSVRGELPGGRRNMGKYVIALDQGTTSSRCILFDEQGTIWLRGTEGVYTDFSAAGLGGAQSDGDLVFPAVRNHGGDGKNRSALQATSPPSASPISVRLPSYGIRRPENRFTTLSYGSAAGRRTGSRN